MGYETSKFGDAGYTSGTTNVTDNVHNHYGPREVGKTVGTVFTEGNSREVSWDIDGTMVGNAAFALDAPVLKAGSMIKEVIVEVTEAYVLGGTTPAIEVGTETSEATNGFTIAEATAEATGVYDLTSELSGTWDTTTNGGLAADTTVGIALSGTTPTVTSAGKMRVVVRYDYF